MDERYYALRMAGVRNIADYNKLGEEEITARLAKKGKDIADLPGIETSMPYIIILVDEAADLMMVNKEVEIDIASRQIAPPGAYHSDHPTPIGGCRYGLIKSNLAHVFPSTFR